MTENVTRVKRHTRTLKIFSLRRLIKFIKNNKNKIERIEFDYDRKSRLLDYWVFGKERIFAIRSGTFSIRGEKSLKKAILRILKIYALAYKRVAERIIGKVKKIILYAKGEGVGIEYIPKHPLQQPIFIALGRIEEYDNGNKISYTIDIEDLKNKLFLV